MFRTRAWVPGCLRAVPWCQGRLPWAPGAPLGGSQGAPGPKLQGPLSVTSPCRPFQIGIKIYVDFWFRCLIVWGSILGASWGSFSVMLAPFSAQVGLGTVFESTYLRKSVFFTKYCVFQRFFTQIDPKMEPRRSKMEPENPNSWLLWSGSRNDPQIAPFGGSTLECFFELFFGDFLEPPFYFFTKPVPKIIPKLGLFLRRPTWLKCNK